MRGLLERAKDLMERGLEFDEILVELDDEFGMTPEGEMLSTLLFEGCEIEEAIDLVDEEFPDEG